MVVRVIKDEINNDSTIENKYFEGKVKNTSKGDSKNLNQLMLKVYTLSNPMIMHLSDSSTVYIPS
jgi:hypothetical protein